MLPRTVVIHNHPIHYKNLLFESLGRKGLPLTVLHQAAQSVMRTGLKPPVARTYSCRILNDGAFEHRPLLSTISAIWNALNTLQPDVVVLGGYSDVGVWTAWLWAQRRRARRILWAETNAFDKHRTFWKEWIKKVFIHGCDAAHVYGKSCRIYLESLGMPPGAILEKRAVVDTRLFMSAGAGRGVAGTAVRDYVQSIYVGRFSPEKNLELLIRALARANSEGGGRQLRMRFIGHGPQEPQLRDWIFRYGVADVVEVLGPRTQEGVRDALRECDFLVLPSLREPYGLVVLEAMAAGLPVIASSQCGCAADCISPQTGWTFDARDADDLVAVFQTIRGLLPQALLEMGAAARTLVQSNGPDECAERVISQLAPYAGSGTAPVAR
jgi:glycosyltransferase involved in cell wall biosynthesis